MRKSLCLGLALTALCAFAGVTAAEVLTHAGAKVQINVPAKWKQEQQGDALSITSPDGAVAVVFAVFPESEGMDKWFAVMDKMLDAKLGEVAWENDGEAVEEEINGMPTLEWNGSAKGGSVLVDALAIDTPSDSDLGIYWFTAAEAQKKWAADVATIVKGLKPAK